MANDKLPVKLLHDHLQTNPRRVLGNQPSELVHCHKHDQFYPKSENRPWCLSWAEEQAERAARKTDPGPGKTPGQLAYEKKGKALPWGWLKPEEKAQWESIARMQNDMAPVVEDETLEEDDYDMWANMVAMRMMSDPYLPVRVQQSLRGYPAKVLVHIARGMYPQIARAYGFFDREPPADP